MTDRPKTPHVADRQRLRPLAQWVLGMLLAALRYLVHRVPLYRRDRRHLLEHPAPDLSREVPGDAASLQRAGQGVGPLYHRRYQIAYTDAERDPEQLIATLRRNPNAAAPVEFAQFQAINGDRDGALRVGDELLVRLPGPWNGPVRVIDVTATSFRFATLNGHMEAGEIEFRTSRNDRGWCVFAIESWARSGDRLYSWLYDRLPIVSLSRPCGRTCATGWRASLDLDEARS